MNNNFNKLFVLFLALLISVNVSFSWLQLFIVCHNQPQIFVADIDSLGNFFFLICTLQLLSDQLGAHIIVKI